ncbi:MAG: glycosyltransferase [Verrucomicrobiota bacterium]
MKQILLVHPSLGPPGGGEGLAACLIQGILDAKKYHLTIACLEPPDFEGLNQFFDTALDPQHPRLTIVASPDKARLMRSLRMTTLPLALLEMSLLERHARNLAHKHNPPFDLFLSTCNEWSFPDSAPALQYIHYPKYHPKRGVGDYRWFHHIPGALKSYRLLSNTLARTNFNRIRQNITLANSAFTAQAYEETHGVPAQIVHPPLPGNPPSPVPWEQRENRIIALGRFSPEKRIPQMIHIVHDLRDSLANRSSSSATPPTLHLIGSWNCPRPHRHKIESLLRKHADWLHLHTDLPRAELDTFLSQSKYGLHAMPDEHFGMAVAEMQRAGCIVFVPQSGGPKEIIGSDSTPQLFSSPSDAVSKLTAALSDSSLQQSLHQRALDRAPRFSTERFINECLQHIDAALDNPSTGL